jgi:hypothetical protein
VKNCCQNFAKKFAQFPPELSPVFEPKWLKFVLKWPACTSKIYDKYLLHNSAYLGQFSKPVFQRLELPQSMGCFLTYFEAVSKICMGQFLLFYCQKLIPFFVVVSDCLRSFELTTSTGIWDRIAAARHSHIARSFLRVASSRFLNLRPLRQTRHPPQPKPHHRIARSSARRRHVAVSNPQPRTTCDYITAVVTPSSQATSSDDFKG